MSGPDKIWICPSGGNWSGVAGGTQTVEYTRTDLIPAMIAKAVAEPVFQLAELQLSRQERDEAIALAALEKAADECALRADQIAIRALANDPAALAEIVGRVK